MHNIQILHDPIWLKQAKGVGIKKNAIMLSGLIFIIFFSRLGIINRVFLAMMCSTSLIFIIKGKTYSNILEETKYDMNIAGQEVRL